MKFIVEYWDKNMKVKKTTIHASSKPKVWDKFYKKYKNCLIIDAYRIKELY